jgi:hypothetical protein
MASAYRDSSEGELVAAVAGKVIRVRRLTVSTEGNGWFQLRHSMGKGGEGDVTQKYYLQIAGTNVLDLAFERDMPQTPRGTSLGVATNLMMTSYSVYVEYELVN